MVDVFMFLLVCCDCHFMGDTFFHAGSPPVVPLIPLLVALLQPPPRKSHCGPQLKR